MERPIVSVAPATAARVRVATPGDRGAIAPAESSLGTDHAGVYRLHHSRTAPRLDTRLSLRVGKENAALLTATTTTRIRPGAPYLDVKGALRDDHSDRDVRHWTMPSGSCAWSDIRLSESRVFMALTIAGPWG